MENGMDDKRFVNPIYVADGPRMIRQISSLDDAINFLQAMPKPVNGTVQETALKACCRAASGQMSVDYARSAFEGFAKISRILEEVPPQWTIGQKMDAGGGASV
jgi:hypothetical protein